jgi:hypothetical protein
MLKEINNVSEQSLDCFEVSIDKEVGNLFQKIAKKRIENFGLQKWMQSECPSCKKKVPIENALDLSINFSPRFLGDISLSYLCSYCCTGFVWHVKCDICNFFDLLNTCSQKESNFESGYQHMFIKENRHNVAELHSKKN